VRLGVRFVGLLSERGEVVRGEAVYGESMTWGYGLWWDCSRETG
jgi:hypothetical protein